MVGHDEAESLHASLGQVMEAARDGDRVWFVDSESRDGSPQIAAGIGAEVVPAPLGKGEAMSTAAVRCDTEHICFVDADLRSSTRNVPATLRDGLAGGEPDLVVAQFDWPAKRIWTTTPGVYNPLVGALFAEAVGRVGDTALSGFRIVRTALVRDGLPPGYRAETWMNIRSALEEWDTRVVDIGVYVGRVDPRPELSLEVAAMILDMAEEHGRLSAAVRPEWDRWVDGVWAVLRDHPAEDADATQYTRDLIAAIERPFPPTGVS